MLKHYTINIDHPHMQRNKANPLYFNVFGLLKNIKDTKLYFDGVESVCIVAENETCVFVGDNFAFLQEILNTLSGHITFCGIADNVYNWLQANFNLVWFSDCWLYVHSGVAVKPSGKYKFQPMEKKYWKLISDGTPYQADKEDIEECLDNRISSAIYIDGKPVCWSLLHKENTLGMLYTLPEHRNSGMALEVMCDITTRQLENGELPFGYINKDNYASMNLAPKYNMQKVCSVMWCGIDF